ncbi:MAG: hypothetical protein N4A57_13060 [Anaeromicrobium sp.]|jgi:type IV pilus assembly protein PilO|uniref:hypothetical protein n=1 Tax=Anaeromicrobium sp. TaxID=1929132 RepID=UPI0025D2F017|nr:hypothetical protein [Anaeromicrobium sp.]MCT4595180.1 hypothetical protein [Anaeromicrobium sp.]
MKLTKREKTLLICLGVILLLGGYYQFVLGPQMRNVAQLKSDVQAYRDEVNKTKIEISPNSKIHKNFKIMNSKIAVVSERLFPKIIQEKIITILDEMIDASQIEILSMEFSEEELKEMEKKKEETKEEDHVLRDLVLEYHGKSSEDGEDLVEDKNPQDEEVENKLEKTTITISYEGSYDEIMAFVENIESSPRKIIIKSLILTQLEEGPMAGNIVLDFYGLPKIHVQDEDYLNWHIENEYGKDNPFSVFSGYTSGSTRTNDSPVVKRKKYEFVMTVKPVTSDIPTVVMGKTDNRNSRSYVHADNPNFENVEFEIIEEEGKYFYKYKTQSESYPRDYENSKISFTPKGNEIGLNIITHKRNSSEDTSGVNLSLINKSNLKLNVKIDYDDTKKTRVNIIKNIGNVEVKR